MGETTVLKRPEELRDEVSVRPGLHRAKTGTHEVVWFDPALLKLREEKEHSLDRDELLQGTPEQIAEGLSRYERWRERRSETLHAGAQPGTTVRRAVDMPAVSETEHIRVEVVHVPAATQRPAGRRFGRLVHAILQVARNADEIEAVASAQGRRLGSSVEEVQAAVASARTALAHPLLQQAVGSRCYREMPVMLRLQDGTLVEGNLDLAWTDGESWTVVDYKTDAADRMQYRRQLQMYGFALQRATNLPVRCVLLEV
jgi:ATP-dependent exoDNAse (exonuclease V) beta subunit